MSSVINETPSATPNFGTELAAELADLVPEAVTDGKLDVIRLTELLNEDAGTESERFGLFWPGKRRALKAAQEPTTATLKPCPDLSKDWDTTQNVFIEGDNLEVLKILQRHYHGKIKMIYIDPPYNTGQDFIYPDNYREGLNSYLEFTKQVDEGGKNLSTNSESEGRFHSNWLIMMYPRLKLARNLLADDGLVFCSISDTECAHLSMVMAEVFGEENRVENFVWQSIFRPSNMSRRVRRNAEYIVCYARNAKALGDFVERLQEPQGEASLTQNNNAVRTLEFPKNSLVVKLADGTYAAGEVGDLRLESDLVVSDETNVLPLKISGKFKWSQEYLEEEIRKGVFLIIKTHSFIPYYRKDYQQSALRPTKILPRDIVGDVLQANAELHQLGLSNAFDYPKPTSLVSQLMTMSGVAGDDIVLDFFAGSGSSPHAVMALNAKDGGSRRWIAVQLPEPTASDSEARQAGFSTIAGLARARIDRAGDKVRDGLAGQSDDRVLPLDIGYRAYKLVDTNFTKWRVSSDVELNALEQHLLDLRDSSATDATADDLLTEILLKQGHSLTERAKTVDVAGLDVFSIGDNLLLAYLDEHKKPSLEQFRAMVDAAGAKIVVLENAFQGDDELKTNVVQLCKTKNVELWTA